MNGFKKIVETIAYPPGTPCDNVYTYGFCQVFEDIPPIIEEIQKKSYCEVKIIEISQGFVIVGLRQVMRDRGNE